MNPRDRENSFVRFHEDWNASLPVPCILELDHSWPSVGVIDLLLSKLRSVTAYDDAQRRLLKECSSYLAIIVATIWELTSNEITLRDGAEGIEIRRESSDVPGPTVRYPLERELRSRLTNPPPCLRHPLDHLYRSDKGLISEFTFSALLGRELYPAGGDEQQRQVSKAVDALARSASEWYRKHFPYDVVGRNENLYRRALIVPPLDLGDAVPAQDAVLGLIGYFREWSLSPTEIVNVCRNLSTCPDELIAVAAIVVLCAVSDHRPPAQAIAASQAKGSFLGLLRQTMLSARAELGLPGDWIFTPAFGRTESFRFELESSMGFLPLMYLDPSIIECVHRNQELREIVFAIAESNIELACALIDRGLQKNGPNLHLQLQRAYLDIVSGRLPDALRLLESVSSAPGVGESARYHDLLGTCLLIRKQVDQSIEHFRRAVALCGRNPALRATIANNFAAALVCSSDPEKALLMLNIALRDGASPVWPLLTKELLFRDVGLPQQQDETRRALLALAPFDRRVAVMQWEQHRARTPEFDSAATLPGAFEGATKGSVKG